MMLHLGNIFQLKVMMSDIKMRDYNASPRDGAGHRLPHARLS